MRFNELLQWFGALFIIAGHVLNAIGLDGWNILAFTIGTVAFLTWTVRVSNHPQMTVNIVALMICIIGLWRFGI
jgi:hypothetical protein